MMPMQHGERDGKLLLFALGHYWEITPLAHSLSEVWLQDQGYIFSCK